MAERKNTKKSTKSKKTSNNKTNNTSFIKDEITILLSFTVCVLLMVSHFGVGGFLGNAVSKFLFGLFGIMAYVIPIVIFVAIAFVRSNRGNANAYIKTTAGIIIAIMLCIIFQLIFEGDSADLTVKELYKVCSENKTAGGLLGGLLAKWLCPAIGLIGTYLFSCVFVIIGFVILTGKSFVGGVKKSSKKAYDVAKEDAKKRHERAEMRREQRMIEQEKEIQRKDKVVSGVSFDTTLAKKSPNIREITPVKEEPVVEQPPVEEIFEPYEQPSFEELVINRSLPIMEDYEISDDIPEIEVAPQEEVTARKRKSTKESKQAAAEEAVNVEDEIKKNEEKPKKVYQFPPLTLLTKGRHTRGDSDAHLRETAMKLQQTLQSFNVNATVTNVSCGPTVTRYELQPEQGVKVSKIVGLADDIKLNLAAADIRIEAPIPGKAAVGIEVPNKENAAVMLRDLLESDEFTNNKSRIAFAVGKDLGGQVVVADIAKMPHLLIAGATGSGKSVCINTLIMSILYRANPVDVKLIMIDPKVVELSVYNGIPHLLIPVVTDPKKAAGALNWAVAEMTRRYQLLAEYNVRDLAGYNQKVESIQDIEDENKPQKLPQIVIIVDELADLMMVAPGEVEDAICRLAQLARACGIHLVVATQRPSVNVITGLIKANMPSRIAFSVSSGVDSRTILDMNGAEKLLGKGDMLFAPQGYPKPARVQGSFVSDKEVQAVVDFLVDNAGGVTYSEEITNHMNSANSGASASAASGGGDDRDVYFVDAGKFVIEKDKASIGMLQRVFKIGFNRAARIMDQLAEAGVVGEEEGTKPRKVLMSMEQFEDYIDEYV